MQHIPHTDIHTNTNHTHTNIIQTQIHNTRTDGGFGVEVKINDEVKIQYDFIDDVELQDKADNAEVKVSCSIGKQRNLKALNSVFCSRKLSKEDICHIRFVYQNSGGVVVCEILLWGII